MNKTTDTRFFTNEKDSSLLDRFKKTLKHVGNFDVLVGYFRSSGFYTLYKELEQIDEIRILNGLDVDEKTFQAVEEVKNEFDFQSSTRIKDKFANDLEKEVANSDDTYDTYEGFQKFKEFLISGKIKLKQHPSHKIHAKVYISRFKGDIAEIEYGRVITGSSNFSYSGFKDNYEFNVELKDKTDVDYALSMFERLWLEGEDLKQIFLDTLDKKTWLNDKVTPYELYLKTLYEYFYEDVNLDQETNFNLPDDFLDLEYQKQAVVAASKILDAYNGVFLSDVVGIGKTYIAALLAQQPDLMPEWKLIICPPVLVEYWDETFKEFNLSKYNVVSAGKIKDIKNHSKFNDYKYVFIDEAHRFRNEDTETYEDLYDVCYGKKIILISATPLNNKYSDILSQLKLFQRPNRSNIPAVRNLPNFFKNLEKLKKEAMEKDIDERKKVIQECSRQIRERVFKHVMVRRTRKEIKEFFSKDIKQQGLSFPEVADPKALPYEFDEEINTIFNQTIAIIQHQFLKARYTPYKYLKKKPADFDIARQDNLGTFMKTMLVKRLESSFHAFKLTVGRFIQSHEDFVRMFNSGTVMISKKLNVFDLMDEDDEEKINKLIEEERLEKFDSSDFKDNFIEDIQKDIESLRAIEDLWKDVKKDPKIEKLKLELEKDEKLKNNKVVMFTESAETGDYLLKNLSKKYKSTVMFYSSKGGFFFDKEGKKRTLTIKESRLKIRKNFDPNIKKDNRENDIRILIATDVLAEGVNLHRSNIELNYDLPWNPTKVIQRTGRVNRVGTEFDKVYIYNFFPTEQSDDEINQKRNILSKIHAIHSCLGNDSKYLTDTEEVDTYQLFGDKLYDNLNNKEFYEEDEEEGVSELKYLTILREIRDNDIETYSKIKSIAKKSRSGKLGPKGKKNSVISFFRKGKLKKFLFSHNQIVNELPFLEAINILECSQNELKQTIPKDFFTQLEANKYYFDEILSQSEEEKTQRRGKSNERELLDILKTFRNETSFQEEDHELVSKLIRAFDDGVIARKKSKKILKEIKLEDQKTPIRILSIFRRNISDKYLDETIKEQMVFGGKREIILSEYLV